MREPDPGPYGRVKCITPVCRRTFKKVGPGRESVICGRCMRTVEPRFRAQFKEAKAGFRRWNTRKHQLALLNAMPASADEPKERRVRRCIAAVNLTQWAYVVQESAAWRRIVREATINRAMGVG